MNLILVYHWKASRCANYFKAIEESSSNWPARSGLWPAYFSHAMREKEIDVIPVRSVIKDISLIVESARSLSFALLDLFL